MKCERTIHYSALLSGNEIKFRLEHDTEMGKWNFQAYRKQEDLVNVYKNTTKRNVS